MTNWQRVAVVAVALALAGCSKPAVIDLKTALVSLRTAGEQYSGQDNETLAAYQALLAAARTRFTAAKPQLAADAAAATGAALDRAADAELVWRYTAGIADGLTPWVEPPLLRLKIVPSDKAFQQLAASFISVQQSPDDDSEEQALAKEKSRNQGRQDLIRQSLDAADQALVKAEASL